MTALREEHLTWKGGSPEIYRALFLRAVGLGLERLEVREAELVGEWVDDPQLGSELRRWGWRINEPPRRERGRGVVSADSLSGARRVPADSVADTWLRAAWNEHVRPLQLSAVIPPDRRVMTVNMFDVDSLTLDATTAAVPLGELRGALVSHADRLGVAVH